MSAELPVGTLLESADASPAHLIATKLNRHTFWCGQSGSGKTYALGVLLEQMMLRTELPIVILDPNSDFVRLDDLRADADPALAAALAERDIRVRRPGDPERPFHAQFRHLSLRARAAIMQLDPLRDVEEFNAMLAFENEVPDIPDRDLVRHLRASGGPLGDRLAMRLENLGVASWDLWAWGDRAITADIDDKPDVVVADLAGFPTQAESRAAALAVLEHLWRNREERIGRLIVIDEAHNLCPPDPVTEVDRLLTELIVQIAAEGRKYGLWLLLSTQRPTKVHPNAVSQCDNLALMKMSAPRDLDELSALFGYAPQDLIERSPGFAQGQALFAGGFVGGATLVQMGARLTHEGGIDVPVPLR
jgi:DNA helicase HerA-like ATPase